MQAPKRLIFASFLCIASLEPIHAETPTEAVDRVWKDYFADSASKDNFPPAFWRYSRAVAHEQGVPVIPAILARSKSWTGEEVLVFVPLVSFLPQYQVVPMLEKVKKTGSPLEMQCAEDLLIELKSLQKLTPAERKSTVGR